MNHELAEQTQAVDKYLLNELSEASGWNSKNITLSARLARTSSSKTRSLIDNLKQVLLEDQRETSEQRVTASPKQAELARHG